jgi:hypothetical protein
MAEAETAMRATAPRNFILSLGGVEALLQGRGRALIKSGVSCRKCEFGALGTHVFGMHEQRNIFILQSEPPCWLALERATTPSIERGSKIASPLL